MVRRFDQLLKIPRHMLLSKFQSSIAHAQ